MFEALENFMELAKKSRAEIPIEQIITDYYKRLGDIGRSPKTIEMYRIHLSRFLEWLNETFGVADPRKINRVDAAFYRRHLQDNGKKKSTVDSAMAAIHAFGSWLADEGYTEGNPIPPLHRTPEPRIFPRLTNVQRIRVLRNVADLQDKRNKVIILLMIWAGLTAEEVVNLKPTDILLGESKVSIYVRSEKGSSRVVPVPADLRKELVEYLGGRATKKWLFESQRRSGITYLGVYHMVRHFGKTCGIEDLNPSMLRYTFGAYLLQQGVPLQTVAKLMGLRLSAASLLYSSNSDVKGGPV